MRTFLLATVLSAVSTSAFAVFSVAPLPEPGVLELIALGAVAVVLIRLTKRRK
jgi:hypothetical protein